MECISWKEENTRVTKLLQIVPDGCEFVWPVVQSSFSEFQCHQNVNFKYIHNSHRHMQMANNFTRVCLSIFSGYNISTTYMQNFILTISRPSLNIKIIELRSRSNEENSIFYITLSKSYQVEMKYSLNCKCFFVIYVLCGWYYLWLKAIFTRWCYHLQINLIYIDKNNCCTLIWQIIMLQSARLAFWLYEMWNMTFVLHNLVSCGSATQFNLNIQSQKSVMGVVKPNVKVARPRPHSGSSPTKPVALLSPVIALTGICHSLVYFMVKIIHASENQRIFESQLIYFTPWQIPQHRYHTWK